MGLNNIDKIRAANARIVEALMTIAELESQLTEANAREEAAKRAAREITACFNRVEAERDRLRLALKKCEQLLLKRGDPWDGDDWQMMQDVRAAIDDPTLPAETHGKDEPINPLVPKGAMRI